MSADIEIEFILATKTPDGSCFSGITRTQSPFSYVSDFSQSSNQINAIIAGNDAYQSNWPGDSYLNIIVCGNPSNGVAGYPHYPSNFFGNSMENGIWMKYNYMGSIGTSDPTRSRVIAHEVGHTLGLRHNFAGYMAANISLSDRKKVLDDILSERPLPSHSPVVVTSSVMDYLIFEDSIKFAISKESFFPNPRGFSIKQCFLCSVIFLTNS